MTTRLEDPPATSAAIPTTGPTGRDGLPTLLAGLRGTVLEIGPGTGANLPSFGHQVRWIGVEPDPVGRDRTTRLAEGLGRTIELIAGRVEDLDLPAGSVDAVVGTYVLCSVEDQVRSLAQVRRVLRPGGIYVFAEHVAAARGTWTRRGQHLIALTAVQAGACRPNRDTEVAIRGAGFAEVGLWHRTAPGPLGTRIPLIAGIATTIDLPREH